MTTVQIENPAMRRAAEHLARAEKTHAAALEERRQTEDHADKIRSRIASIDADRAGIVQRRAAGQLEASDGERLHLLAADREGLEAMQRDAASAKAAAQQKAQAAAGAVEAARHPLQRLADEAEEAALVEYAQKLDKATIEAAGRIKAVASRPGRAPGWYPSDRGYELMRELRLRTGRL